MRERRLRLREMFVPLTHPPGHAQADFGQAAVVLGGVERTAHIFVMDLPHSDASFVKAYPAERREAFCEGHNAAFAFFGGVPLSVLYDNTRIAVARITWTESGRFTFSSETIRWIKFGLLFFQAILKRFGKFQGDSRQSL